MDAFKEISEFPEDFGGGNKAENGRLTYIFGCAVKNPETKQSGLFQRTKGLIEQNPKRRQRVNFSLKKG